MVIECEKADKGKRYLWRNDSLFDIVHESDRVVSLVTSDCMTLGRTRQIATKILVLM